MLNDFQMDLDLTCVSVQLPWITPFASLYFSKLTSKVVQQTLDSLALQESQMLLRIIPKSFFWMFQETKTQYIAEIEFCISKKFEIIKCPTRHPETRETELDFVELRSLSRYQNTYVSMVQKRKSQGPETCESQPKSSNRRYGQQSPCRDTERIAYPVIKPF